jgi:hypothetical protein
MMVKVLTFPGGFPIQDIPQRGRRGAGLGFAPLLAIAIPAAISIAQQLLIGPIKKLISGCGPSCVMTSNWANQAEAILKQNLDAWRASATKTQSVQAAFLANFDAVWNHLVQQCGQVSGPAGQNCIGDRQSGACHFKDAGQCWNWFIGYRDPIANDPSVVPDTAASAINTAASSASGLLSSLGAGGVNPGLLLLGGLALLAVAS